MRRLAARLEPWLACAALAAACVQVPVLSVAAGKDGAGGLPCSTVLLVLAVLARVLSGGRSAAPAVDWPLAAFLALVPCGLLGMHAGQAGEAAKEAVQLAEICLVAPWYFRSAGEETWRRCKATLALMAAALPPAFLAGLLDRPPFGLSAAKFALLELMCAPFLLEAVARHAAAPFVAGLLAACAGLGFRHGGAIAAFLLLVLAWQVGRRFPAWIVAGTLGLGLLASFLQGAGGPGPWNALDPAYDGTHRKRLFIEYEASLQAPLRVPFGGGLGQYKETINQLRQFGDDLPHPADTKIPRDGNCQYLLTVVESGLPAGIALLALFLRALVDSWRRAREAGGGDLSVPLALLGLLLGALFCVALSRGSGLLVGALLGCALRGVHLRATGWSVAVVGVVWIQCLVAMLLQGAPGPGEPVAANRAASAWLLGLAGPRPGPEIVYLAEEGGVLSREVRVEAESCAEISPPMAIVPANGVSGDRCLEIPDKAGKGTGRAVYLFQVPGEGDYRLFVRVWWEDGCANSLGCKVGGVILELQSSMFLTWHLLESRRSVHLGAGTHRLELVNLEDGIRLDYWGLREE